MLILGVFFVGCGSREVPLTNKPDSKNDSLRAITHFKSDSIIETSLEDSKKIVFDEQKKILSFIGNSSKGIEKINLDDYNYFANLNAPTLEKGSNWIDINTLTIDQKTSLFKSMEINPKINDTIPSKILIPSYLVSIIKEKVAVSYSLEVFSSGEGVDGKYGNMIGGIGKVLIFNSNGKLEQVINDNRNSIKHIEFTKNGTYIATVRGEGNNPDRITMDVGFKFYDINTGELLYDFNCGNLDCQTIGPQNENRFIFNIYEKPDSIQFNIIDFDEKSHLTKKMLLSKLLEAKNGSLKLKKDFALFKEDNDTLWFNNTKF